MGDPDHENRSGISPSIGRRTRRDACTFGSYHWIARGFPKTAASKPIHKSGRQGQSCVRKTCQATEPRGNHMRHTKTVLTITIIFTAITSAFAHSDVATPAVAKRMMGMEAIGSASKTIGNMARGRMAFDPGKAQEAAREIAKHALEIPALFKMPEQDPQSEALPGIWTNFDDFTAQAAALNKAAEKAAKEEEKAAKKAAEEAAKRAKKAAEAAKKAARED